MYLQQKTREALIIKVFLFEGFANNKLDSILHGEENNFWRLRIAGSLVQAKVPIITPDAVS